MSPRLPASLSAFPMAGCGPGDTWRSCCQYRICKAPPMIQSPLTSLEPPHSTLLHFLGVALMIYNSHKSAQAIGFVVGCGGVSKTCQLLGCCLLKRACFIPFFHVEPETLSW